MSRILLLFILSICFTSTYAQNWKPVQPNIKRYYANDYLRGIRVDSITTSGGDTVLHLFRTPRGVYDIYVGGTLDTNGGCWLGKTVIYQSNGVVLTHTWWGDTVVLNTHAAVGESWMFYNDTSSQYYIATVADIDTATILNTLDSIKTITIAAYNANGLNTADSLDNLEIFLSKEHGYWKTPSTYMFPYHPMHLQKHERGFDYYTDWLDIGYFNGYFIPKRPKSFTLVDFRNPTGIELFDASVGDIFFYYRYVVTQSSGDTSIFSYDTVTSKTANSLGGYTYIFNQQLRKQTQNAGVYSPFTVSYSNYQKSTEANIVMIVDTLIMPEETNVMQDYQFNENSNYYCYSNSTFITSTNRIINGWLDNNEWFCGAGRLYKNGLGLTNISECVYTAGILGHSLQLYYYKKDTLACGQPNLAVAGVSNNQLSFSIHPNPAAITTTLSFTSAKSVYYQIMNIIGSVVQSGITKSGISIPISELPNGLYLIKIADGTSAQVQKLVVQH